MDTVVTGLFVFAIVSIAIVIFIMWVFGRLAVAMGRRLGFISTPQMIPSPRDMAEASYGMQRAAAKESIQCRVAGCRHVNPAGAQFCRHCGHAFPQGNRAALRRAVTT